MSTHITQCVICGENVPCCEDIHALGIGGNHGEGGCGNPPYIEFCSPEHYFELLRRLEERLDRAKSLQAGTYDKDYLDF